MLPLEKGTCISVFGRTQTDYNKSGTGSGGMVNVDEVKSIIQCLMECEDVSVNTELLNIYKDWIKVNPYDNGTGWASEPWAQKEMSLTDEIVNTAAEKSDVAVVIISRTAGEDKDNSAIKGSYLLSNEEDDMIKKVSGAFEKVCVLLNVGNIISTNFTEKYSVGALLYIWQGGQFGAEVIPDILTGKINPSGKLSDTVAKEISDYPSNDGFGAEDRVIYKDDIYVGYRYFETFAKNRVVYPFGFGLSYTTFDIKCISAVCDGEKINLDIEVTNTGEKSGKEVVQVYYKAPNGKLGQPVMQLVRYEKTKLLEPNESELLKIRFDITEMKSYDDSGITGHKSCYVMEIGDFEIFTGNSVRDNESVFVYHNEELIVVEKLREALAPVQGFERLKAEVVDGEIVKVYESVPTRQIDLNKRIADELPAEILYTGDKGIKLKDVYDGKNTLDEFVAQLTPNQHICLSRGEGMNSPKVTPGTGSAFGGLSPDLQDMGIPPMCTTDGPSGLRLDAGDRATSLPNGTLIACTFNKALIAELFTLHAVELYVYDIDALLGPGMNIHRHPLNGRNFEYFSEDPYLSGTMATEISKGLNTYGATGTIKHFCCNSQESYRHTVDAVLSERALREIYLKGFEIAVRSGYVKAIMTAYNPTNGIYTAGNYDLNTTILRGEWGYKGMVMSDWWADLNDEGEKGSKQNTKAMIRSQNDVYMVVADAYLNSAYDNSQESFDNGLLTLGQLQRNTKNILNFILSSTSFKKYMDNGCVIHKTEEVDLVGKQLIATYENVKNGVDYSIVINEDAEYYFKVDYSMEECSLSQYLMTMYINNTNAATDTVSSADNKKITIKKSVHLANLGETTLRIVGSENVNIDRIEIYVD